MFFKVETPAKTIKLSELYSGSDDPEVEEGFDIEFDIYRSGQRTHNKHFIKLAHTGHLPASVLAGTASDEESQTALTMLVADGDAFEAFAAFVTRGIVADARNIHTEAGVFTLSEMNGKGGELLTEVLRDNPDMGFRLMGAAHEAEAERTAELEAIAKKSSVSLPAKAKKPNQSRKG